MAYKQFDLKSINRKHMFFFIFFYLLTLTATAEELLPHPKGTYRPLGVEPYLLVILYSN